MLRWLDLGMAPKLPQATTAPRGLPPADQIRWPLFAGRELFQLRYGKALVESDRRTGVIPVFGTNGRCGSHDQALFRGPGVVLGRKGQGPLGVEWTREDYWVIDTAYSLLPLRSDIDLKYAYYLIKHVGLNHLKDGTSNPTLSRDSFGAQALPLPPLDQQRAIASILGALDDKIELNRRMNETLEGIARALFKSWFVDFDPVRAKAAGRQPVGMDTETARLFPDRFVEFEIGEVPFGWTSCGLDGIATFLNGLALQKFPASDGEPSLPVIKIAELRSGVTLKSDRANTAVPDQYVVHDGDVLFSWSGSLEIVIWSAGRGALNQHLFKVTSATHPIWFVHAWIEHHLPGFRAIAADKATTMGHIQRRHLAEAKAVIPSKEVSARADAIMQPLWRRRVLNSVQMRTLAVIRDSLLPKLLSGELSVREAKGLVEARS